MTRQKVENLCRAALETQDWFAGLQDNLANLVVATCRDAVCFEVLDGKTFKPDLYMSDLIRVVNKATEVYRPKFHKYDRPDDTQWAGWYEISGETIGFKGLNGSFCPKVEDQNG